MAKKRAVKRGKKHHRRLDDKPPSAKQKVALGTASGSALVGFAAFLWQMIHIVERHSDWAFIHQPPGWAEILRAMFFATVAFGGALFSDFRRLIRMFYTKETPR